jgi:archaemetzincin
MFKQYFSIKISFFLTLFLLQLIFISACESKTKEKNKEGEHVNKLLSVIEKLKPLHKKLSKPKPGEWLSQHIEAGQSFVQYLKYRPIKPEGKRNTIYILPIGSFKEGEKKIVDLTGKFMQLFYSIPVKIMKSIDDKTIPSSARRVHPRWGDKQFLTTHILSKILKKKLPKDGCVILGLTATDLWPGRNWNFVFGEASIRERVGVWSMYRNGKADGTEEEFNICLLRTLKTAIHETGHMFSMLHCTAYECCMCGSNSRVESDTKPLAFCPECMAKLCWMTKTDPLTRFKSLIEFCEKYNFKSDLKLYKKQIKLLEEE